MLRNVIYAGYVEAPCWGIARRKGHHEPLISLETYQRIQDRLAGIGRATYRKNLNEDFPLRGFVMCDDCGEPLTASWTSGSHAKHPYYLCHRKGCASYGKSIKRAEMEGRFEELLHRIQPSQKVVALATAMFKELWKRRSANVQQQAPGLTAELARVEREVDQCVSRIVETSIPAVIRAFEGKIERLENEKPILRERIAKSAAPRHDSDLRLRTALGFLANPCNLWQTGRLEARHAVLKLTFADNLRYKRGEGFRTANLSLPFKVLGDFLSGEKGVARPTGIEPVFSP
jgi:site-specific DNA recombinase